MEDNVRKRRKKSAKLIYANNDEQTSLSLFLCVRRSLNVAIHTKVKQEWFKTFQTGLLNRGYMTTLGVLDKYCKICFIHVNLYWSCSVSVHSCRSLSVSKFKRAKTFVIISTDDLIDSSTRAHSTVKRPK